MYIKGNTLHENQKCPVTTPLKLMLVTFVTFVRTKRLFVQLSFIATVLEESCIIESSRGVVIAREILEMNSDV